MQIIVKIINNIIKENNLQEEIQIAYMEKDPLKILEFIKNDMRPGIYFLDVDLGKGVMTGIELGVNIRILDPAAYIVMVTNHAEAASLTYKYKIGTKDYILKDEREEMLGRIRECIIQGHEDILKKEKEDTKIVLLKKDSSPFTMYANQIYCIEVVAKTQRKLRVYERYSSTEVASTLIELKTQLDKSFFQCHKSYIINVKHIKEINKKENVVVLKNGREIPVSFRLRRPLEKFYLKFLLKN